LILLIVLGLLDVLGKRRPIQFSSVDAAAFLFIIWTAVSIYNSSDIRVSLFELLRMTKLYLLSRVVASNVKGKGDTQDVMIALVIGLMVQGVICVLQYTGGTDLGLGLFTVGDLRRVSGTVGWPNTLGAYAATVLSVTLALWIYGARGRLRIPIGAACMAGLFSLTLSFSRGAWISLLAGVAVVLFWGWRAAWLGTRSFPSLSVIALSAAIVGALFATSIAARLAEVHPRMDVVVDRMQLNRVAMNMISAHPLLGVGINTFVDTMKQYDTTGVTYYFPQPVHNVFLLVAAEAGLVGLGLFLLLIFTAFRAGLQASKTDDRFLSACAIGISSGLIVLVVNNLADCHLRTEVLYALFWLLIGLVVAVKRMTISAAS
jgi:putative inorganic carbon (HCO3(-)) transporter